MLCDVEEKIRSNAATNATNATSKQPADKTSRIKDMHVYGLLALNPGPIDKNNSKEMLPKPVRQKMLANMPTFPITAPAPEAISAAGSTTASPMQVLGMFGMRARCALAPLELTRKPLLQVDATYKQVLCEKQSFPPSAMSSSMKYTGLQAPGDSGMPSIASSPASVLSLTHSVAESVEFSETNPEALGGLGLGIDAIEQKAPGDAVVNDTESEGEGEEISTGAALAVPMQQVCLSSKSCVLKFSFSKSCVFDPYHF